MRLFDVIKYFSFDEKCRVYTNETEEDYVEFEGEVSDIPYWLCELKLIKDGGIGTEDGMIYFFVEA
jgi:hypothetical protein